MSTASPSQPPAGTNAPPVHALRRHGLRAAVWRNPTRHGPMYTVTLVRTFKDGDEFRDTPSLNFGDLANAAKLLLDAESWIAARAEADRAAEDGSTGTPPGLPSAKGPRRAGGGRGS